MNEDEFLNKIKQKIRSLDIAEQVIYPAAASINTEMRNRIISKGIGGDGAKIGSYDTSPIYASRKQFRNTGAFKPQGKTGKKKEDRKTMYLAGGYRQLRQIQGYQSGFVNLFYYGNLMGELAKLTVDKDTVMVKVSRQENIKKLQGLKERYGEETFQHTRKERKDFANIVRILLTEYFSK